MKLLPDQGLPRTAALLLRAGGLDTVHVGEINMATAGDAAILQRGLEDGRVVITLDADFHTLLARSGATAPSVVRLRIEGLRGEATAQLLQTVLTHCAEELTLGAVVTVQQDRVRVRRLPLA